MSFEQKQSFKKYLEGSIGILHHGMCVGGDADGHRIARQIGYFMVGHPPTDTSLMATDLHCEEMWPAKPYLDRNKDIVKCGHALIAAPSEPEEQPLGGTWSTVRFARKLGRTIILILPNGKIVQRDYRAAVGTPLQPSPAVEK